MSTANKQWFNNKFNLVAQDNTAITAKPKTRMKEKPKAPEVVAQTFKSSQFMSQIEPKTEADLAVHLKKIAEVKTWMQDHVITPRPNITNVPMLLLTGPIGCGKTATLKVLCKSHNVHIQEWVSPIDKDFELYKGPGQATQLTEFLIDSQYPSLFNKRKKLTLIEDFPNVLINKPEEFDNILSHCISNAKSVIVFIVSDSNSRSLDITKNLFTQETRLKYNICEISFNACSVTLLKQALNRAQELVKENLGSLTVPSPAVFDAIINTCNGDLRCAINQYYFTALKGTSHIPLELTQSVKAKDLKRKRGSKKATIKSMTKDENLGLFHAIGRVLNPKINENMRIHCEFDPLIDELCTNPGTMVAFLQENYIKYFGTIEDLQSAAECLSLSQTFLEKWTGRHETFVMALWISVLGLMVFNVHGNSRWTPICGPFKIVKKSNDSLETRSLCATDLGYYNFINRNSQKRFGAKKY